MTHTSDLINSLPEDFLGVIEDDGVPVGFVLDPESEMEQEEAEEIFSDQLIATQPDDE